MNTLTVTEVPTQAPRPLRQLRDLPGPRGIPLFGNALQVDTARFHLQIEQWCREFGPYFKLHLGPQPVLVVGDHEAVAAMLRDRPDGFRRPLRGTQIAEEMALPASVFRNEGEAWRRQRKLVMAGFDPAHVRGYFPAMQKVAQRLVGRWHRAARADSAIELQADLMRYTVDTIAGLAFGAEVNTLESDGDVIQRHLDKIFPALNRRLFAPIPYWRYVRLPADRQLDRSIVQVKAAIDDFIALARARLQADAALRQHPRNLLEAMIAAADEPGSGIDDAQVAGNVLGMLLAGEDTTANTLAWMIHLLWRHPQALARATDEVRRVVSDPARPTLEQMGQLDYLEACAHETMRLKPVAPQIPLQALRDSVVGDVAVPAGMVVIGLMRRDSVSEQHVPRAALFEPERWLVDGGTGPAAARAAGSAGSVGSVGSVGSAGLASSASMASSANSTKRVSMPFGAGPRMCPGRYLALLEMKLAMVALLGHFDIASVDTPDGKEARERLSFTMTPVGLKMRLRARV